MENLLKNIFESVEHIENLGGTIDFLIDGKFLLFFENNVGWASMNVFKYNKMECPILSESEEKDFVCFLDKLEKNNIQYIENSDLLYFSDSISQAEKDYKKRMF